MNDFCESQQSCLSHCGRALISYVSHYKPILYLSILSAKHGRLYSNPSWAHFLTVTLHFAKKAAAAPLVRPVVSPPPLWGPTTMSPGMTGASPVFLVVAYDNWLVIGYVHCYHGRTSDPMDIIYGLNVLRCGMEQLRLSHAKAEPFNWAKPIESDIYRHTELFIMSYCRYIAYRLGTR